MRQKKPHLKQRKDGRYRCKYKDMVFYGRTEEEAFSLRDEYIRSQRKGFNRLTVSEYALPWLKRTYPEVSDSTYTGLAIHLQHLVDAIGNKKISEVVPSDIKNVYSTEYKGCSTSYMKSAKQLFSSLFDAAVADRLIVSNPARDKTAKPHKGAAPKTRPITEQERGWILTYCTEHRAYPAVMTMLYAGLRPPEMKALKIERDVDFKKKTITLHEFAHNDGSRYKFTDSGKTENAVRTIPLFPVLEEVLKGRKGNLISSAHGERVNQTTWRVAWSSYKHQMETAINGIEKRWYGRTKEQQELKDKGLLPDWISFDIVPYDLRHSFCVMLRNSGVEMNTARKWMGHSDAKMILKVYDAVSEDRSENERKKVENRLFRVQSGVQPEKESAVSIEE